MPNGPRIRANNVYGVISDNPLTAASGTFNSTSLPLLPIVSAAHAIVVFDPKRVYGDPEIVVVTAHTVGSTVASILRGQYGTSTREHPQGTAWAHVPIDEDYTEILTSATRPSDPYLGQMIFETNTDKFVARNAANTDWIDAIPLGAWQTWVPAWTNFTPGSASTTARYARVGRIVHYYLRVVLNGSTMSSDPRFTLPVTAASTYSVVAPIGTADYLDSGTVDVQGLVWASSTTTGRLIVYGTAGAFPASALVTSTVPFTWANNDEINVVGTYEAAS